MTLLAGSTLELGTEGREQDDHRVVPRQGQHLLECGRVEFDDAPCLGCFCIQVCHFDVELCRWVGLGGTDGQEDGHQGAGPGHEGCRRACSHLECVCECVCAVWKS